MALGNWWDLLVVIVFSLAIFYYAVSLAMEADKVGEAVRLEEIAEEKKDENLNLPG